MCVGEIQGRTTTRILHGLEDLGLLEVLDYTSASLLKTHGKLVQGRTYGRGRLTSVDSP